MATRRDRGADTPGLSMPFEDRAVRARIAGKSCAFLTIRGRRTVSAVSSTNTKSRWKTRPRCWIGLRTSIDRETRHTVSVNGREWVIDVFEGDNAGLVLAEIELWTRCR